MKLWICSNEPEICDFMTNNLKGGDLPILKCDCCKDGYLIVKKDGENRFWDVRITGPTGAECNRAISSGQVFEVCKAVFDE